MLKACCNMSRLMSGFGLRLARFLQSFGWRKQSCLNCIIAKVMKRKPFDPTTSVYTQEIAVLFMVWMLLYIFFLKGNIEKKIHMHVQCIRKWTQGFVPEWNLSPQQETQLSRFSRQHSQWRTSLWQCLNKLHPNRINQRLKVWTLLAVNAQSRIVLD